ncbi:MAG: PHP domain-containing protein [Synergistaceae bacterium]|jgi:predicted metal-dependent phosphoesterase TrpH|nr:PHP domain-containing protein [Synergistaceae bacterium]
MKIDLHVHSCFSDGTFLPAQIILKAKQEGLDIAALTDHDTTAGLFHVFYAENFLRNRVA